MGHIVDPTSNAMVSQYAEIPVLCSTQRHLSTEPTGVAFLLSLLDRTVQIPQHEHLQREAVLFTSNGHFVCRGGRSKRISHQNLICILVFHSDYMFGQSYFDSGILTILVVLNKLQSFFLYKSSVP
jgi:hypothetical protein